MPFEYFSDESASVPNDAFNHRLQVLVNSTSVVLAILDANCTVIAAYPIALTDIPEFISTLHLAVDRIIGADAGDLSAN